MKLIWYYNFQTQKITMPENAGYVYITHGTATKVTATLIGACVWRGGKPSHLLPVDSLCKVLEAKHTPN